MYVAIAVPSAMGIALGIGVHVVNEQGGQPIQDVFGNTVVTQLPDSVL